MADRDTPEVRVPGAFEDLYRREYDAMVALAYGMTGSRAAAEEVAQEAFLKTLKNWDRVRVMSSPGGWVRVVTLNQARSRWRRLKIEVASLLRVESTTSSELDSSAEAEEFWAMVRRLPTRQAQVLVLHYVEDRSVSGIADLLNIAEGTVKALLHQARHKLRGQLEAEGWVSDGV